MLKVLIKYLALYCVLSCQNINACTIFNITMDGKTLVGNNEDFIYSDSKVWFIPKTEDSYGYMLFGFGSNSYWPMGGMNSEGLFFDDALTPSINFKYDPNKITTNHSVAELMLKKCSTTEEAIRFLKNYNINTLKISHMMIVDKLGKSAIIEWCEDSICVFVKEKNYQILTNFNIYSKPAIVDYGRYGVCERYLRNCNTASIDYVKKILNAVHQKGEYTTVYSNIYDLTERKVYVYYRHNFSYKYVFDIKEELDKGWHMIDLTILFPEVIMQEYNLLDQRKKYSEKQLLDLGSQLVELGKFNEAIDVYTFNIKLYPKSKEGYRMIINVYYIKGNDKKKNKYLKKLNLL